MKKFFYVLTSSALIATNATAAPAALQPFDKGLSGESVLLVVLAALFLLVFWFLVHRADEVKARLVERVLPWLAEKSESLRKMLALCEQAAREAGLPTSVVGSFIALAVMGFVAVRYSTAGAGLFAVIALGVLLAGGCQVLVQDWLAPRMDGFWVSIAFGHALLFTAYLLASTTGHWSGALEVFAVGFKVYVPSAVCFAVLFRGFDTVKPGVSAKPALAWAGIAGLVLTAALCLALGQAMAGAVLSSWVSAAVLRWFIGRLTSQM